MTPSSCSSLMTNAESGGWGAVGGEGGGQNNSESRLLTYAIQRGASYWYMIHIERESTQHLYSEYLGYT